MIAVHFKMHCRPGRADEVAALLARVVGPSRRVPGVLSFDIGRDVDDPDRFVATEVFEDRAALERQEALPEVEAVMAAFETALVAEPEATVLRVSGSEPYGG